MKVSVCNTWMDNENFFIFKLLKNLYSEVEFTSDNINCDILIYSVFGNSDSFKYSKAKYKIFCSWETRFYLDILKERIDYADICLTYMPTKDKNFRLPLWYLWIDWWNENSSDNLNVICSQSHHYIGKNLLDSNLVPTPENIKSNIYSSEDIWNRPNFCSMLVGNVEESSIKIRSKVFNDINTNIDKIHGYGLAFNNRFEGNKINLLKNFRFNVCYENSVHEGYVTEKLFDAKFAGCIPIYYGDIKYSEIDFNKNCFINRFNFDSDIDFISFIKSIYSDKEKFIDIANEPLFNNLPTLDNVYEFLKEKIK